MRGPSRLSKLSNAWSWAEKHLNFYRIHLIYFTITPLIFSGIVYAANGANHIPYVDCLFICVSAVTVCGLATFDLSLMTTFQQFLLAFQALVGNPIIVSWVMVYIRRLYFARHFAFVLEQEIAARKAKLELQGNGEDKVPLTRRLTKVFTRNKTQLSTVPETGLAQYDSEKSSKHDGGIKLFRPFSRKSLRKLRPDMIRRMDDAPKPVDPNGWVSTETAPPTPHRSRAPSFAQSVQSRQSRSSRITAMSSENISEMRRSRDGEDSDAPGGPILTNSPMLQQGNTKSGVPLGHTLTVEFKTPERDGRGRRPGLGHERRPSLVQTQSPSIRTRSPTGSRRMSTIIHDDRSYMPTGVPLARRNTTKMSQRSHVSAQTKRTAMTHSYGGFPYPTDLLLRLFKKLFPSVQQRFVRTVTLPRAPTGVSGAGAQPAEAKYVSFEAIVGRNSAFHLLTEEHLQELGGVEYRALTALLWLVALYFFGFLLISFTIIAPYIAIPRWHSVFEPPNLHKFVSPVYFAFFQVVSAFTNTGFSLVDQSMIPFQEAYPMVFTMTILILAGNTAYPVCLRFMIWVITKCVPRDSRINDTLHFLLDHPRRCFVYLFPSHQTWFLLTVVVMLNVTDWFFFLILDIGSSYFEVIPLGVRFAIGLLQATCVRAAGFATVTISNLAPAVQVLYVMMMYISVYPIAMSVRSTNVYEEKSLGVFADDVESDEFEPQKEQSRMAVWGQYLAWHARKQLAFDMWWLGLALFLVCIIERSKIQDEDNFQWFTIFNAVFELVSAYGTVGLSVGLPSANYSFSGAFTPLSKLIVCLVMLRGRHRGLPNAIDRAVMLPKEYKKTLQLGDDDEIIADIPAQNGAADEESNVTPVNDFSRENEKEGSQPREES